MRQYPFAGFDDSKELDCNIFPGTGSSESIPVGRPMDDVLVWFKSQPKTFIDDFGVVGENAELLAELRAISPKSSRTYSFFESIEFLLHE